MYIWHNEDGRKNAAPHARRIIESIEAGLNAYGNPRPSVKSIRIGAGLNDSHDFEIELNLAPGVVLATRYGSVDEEHQPDSLEDEGGAVAWQALDTVREFKAFGTAALADILHNVRVRTREILGEWSAEGTYVTMKDARIVRMEHWALDDALTIELRLYCLDDRLQPQIGRLAIGHPDKLEAELVEWRPQMDVRYAAQAMLAKQGESGFVDRSVVNAISQNDDAAKALQSMTRGHAYGLTEELTVFMYDGHVQCHGRTMDGEVGWNRDSITIDGKSLPESIMKALRGRPVTELLAHPVASSDMILTEVRSEVEYGRQIVRAHFMQPRLLFCGASGRIWRST